jgi:hypothetical protein
LSSDHGDGASDALAGQLRRAEAEVKRLTAELADMRAYAERLFHDHKRLQGAIDPPNPFGKLSPDQRALAEAMTESARSQSRAQARRLQGQCVNAAAGPDGADAWPGLGRIGDDPKRPDGFNRPLNVVLAGEGATMFDLIDDPRIRTTRLSDQAWTSSDVVAWPRAELADLDALSRAVPAEVWRRIGRGETKLVLDSSREGYTHSSEDALKLLQFLADKGVSGSNVIYLTQDRAYRENHERFCRIEARTALNVWVWDYFPSKIISTGLGHGENRYAGRLARRLKRSPVRPKRFVSLNFAPRPTRVLFLLSLIRDGLWERGLVSFGGFSTQERPTRWTTKRVARSLRDLDGFMDIVPEVLPLLRVLEAKGEVLFRVDRERTPEMFRSHLVEDRPMPEYDAAWFTVVTETEMNTRVHRITEKPFKPLLNFHPAILLASVGSLDLIRNYGFRTFEGFFDEAYDEEPDVRRRFDMVYEQVVRMCGMDDATLARLDEGVAEVLSFNAYWGLVELPRLFAEVVGAAFVTRLAAFVAKQGSA